MLECGDTRVYSNKTLRVTSDPLQIWLPWPI
jgi:hypothetical protein